MASSKKLQAGELPAHLETFIRQTIRPGQTLLLALSGGLDSCVLLDLLRRTQAAAGFQLQAFHVNHGISPNAADWERFCGELCAEAGIPFRSEPVSVPRDGGKGLEAAARTARYAVLLNQPVDAVLLAHHQDDQAETMLLQLLRGAGTKGLAAMPLARECQGDSPLLLRPLLAVPRSTLENYARSRNLRWIEDESNLDLAFDRNFLRHHVFPELEKRFPASRGTLARSAEHIAEAALLLDEVAREDASRWIQGGRLSVDGLREMSAPRARNLLRFWLCGHLAQPPSSKRLQEVYRQLTEARPDASLHIRLEGGVVRRYRGEAFIDHSLIAPEPFHSTWHGEAELTLPGGVLTFRHQPGAGLVLGESAVLRVVSRTGGERFRPDCRRPTRSLKHLLQESGMPPWERRDLPLIYRDDVLAAVPGIGVACDLQAGANEAGLVIEWQRK